MAFPSNKSGGRHKSKEYKSWIEKVKTELQQQHPTMEPVVSGKYGLEIQVGRKMTRADIDNLIKPIADILVKSKITPDDRKMEKVSIRKIDGPYVYISIWDMNNDKGD